VQAPDDIARMGFVIAHELNASLPPVPGADEAMVKNAKDIATTLLKAQRPVIISGISCYSEAVIKGGF
jgi:NADH-quinone oxidoreductase subunit G